MKKLLLFALMAVLSTVAFAQDGNYNIRFTEALNDSLPLAEEVLADWEKNGPKDGDYYAAQFNLHFNKGTQFGICMSTELPLYVGEMNMELKDSLGNVSGYMYNGLMSMDSTLVNTAQTWLRKGIELFPERLDLRLGLSSSYRMMNDGDMMFSTMCQSVEYVMAHPDAVYTWTSDEPLDMVDEPIETAIQDYFADCYSSEYWNHLATSFLDLGMKYNPNNVMFINDKAVMLLDKDDVQGALDLMKQALKINPDDEIIKGNIEYLEESLKEGNN